MASHASPCRTLWQAILVYQLGQIVVCIQPAWPANDFENTPYAKYCIGDKSFREPINSDIEVICGPETVYLSILLCPIYFNGYNESLMSLNSLYSNPVCKGDANWAAEPPVLNFNFSITEKGINECRNSLTVSRERGTGYFSQLAWVEYINISGAIASYDHSNGAITYSLESLYKFSCRYPLQYLINNTKMNVTGVTLAVKDTNGSFISTLRMEVYWDDAYTQFLNKPVNLKDRIWVQVVASNLTNRFRVLLDRCYATGSPYYTRNSYYDLFVGCHHDGQTIMGINGQKQFAQFSFEAFKFTEVTNQTISTIYVHCATRLCVDTICPMLMKNCSARNKRSADDPDTSVSDVATVTSRAITIRLDDGYIITGNGFGDESDKTVVAVSIIAGIIGAICLTLVGFIVYNKYYAKKIAGLGKTIMYPRD